jgi:hypothetical protein
MDVAVGAGVVQDLAQGQFHVQQYQTDLQS